MNNIKKSYYINIVIVILEIFSICWMMSGIKLFSNSLGLTASKLEMFKYFTIDSNLLMLIASIITIYEEKKIFKGLKKDLSISTYIIKLMGTVAVTLTMLVTILFLAPTMGIGVVFTDSNFFLHIVNPILSIIAFTLYEKTKKIDFKHTFTACIPLSIYAIYYVLLSMINMENGKVLSGYDWYGFFVLGIYSALFILPVISIFTYLISLVLWDINKIK